MAKFTRIAIMQTFGEMLEEMPFDKITVSALVKRCGIGHNTFYYHYQDIYALFDAWLREELGQYISGIDDWQEGLRNLLRACQNRSKIIYHIFDSLSRDRMERYLFSLTDDLFLNYVARQAEGLVLPRERLQSIADFCRYAFFGFFLRFLWNAMADDVDRMVEELSELFPTFVENALTVAAREEKAPNTP